MGGQRPDSNLCVATDALKIGNAQEKGALQSLCLVLGMAPAGRSRLVPSSCGRRSQKPSPWPKTSGLINRPAWMLTA